MKQLFDIKKSLELCPLNFGSGITHIKRVVLNRSEVTYPTNHQVRVYNVDTKKVPVLKDSFLVNGFIHSEPPPTIKVDPANKNRFIGLSGWHRNAAAEAAQWDTMIYDVLSFDSPKDERIHRNVSNHHRTPFIPVTLNDIVKQVKEAVTNKEIPNTDKEIKDFISIIAADKTEKDQETIFGKFRKHVSHSSTLLCYLSSTTGENSTGLYAEKYNLPFKGTARFNQTGRLGYIFSESTPKTALVEAKKLYRQYNKQVEFYAWIASPLETPGLFDQRKTFKDKFDKFIREDCESMHFLMEKLGFDIDIDVIIKNHPVKFMGFLHQNITPNPFNDGKPMENGIVDVNGNPVLIDVTNTKGKKIPYVGINETMPQKLLDIMNI
jgi:hypothetical protein